MEELLIENVRKYEVLYNHSSRDYRDQRIRQEAWEEIGRELKITAEKAKQLWDKLRRCFNNARNRRLSTKSGQATKTVPPWKFEQEMSFLLPYLEGRRTFSNLIPDVENNADVQESHAIADTEISNATDNEEESRVGTTENTPQGDTQVDKKIDQLHQLQTPKKYSKTTAAAELVHIMKENAHLRKRRYENQDKAADNKKTSPLENMDDTDLFFLTLTKNRRLSEERMYLSAELRDRLLEQRKALRLAAEVCGIISNSSPVYINENFPRLTRELFKKERELKTKGYK
nr:unnamed protein product [Callosobruchus analis]